MDSIAVWWFEEAQFLTQELMDIVTPTARHEMYCTITGLTFPAEQWFVWNPKNRSDWVWVRFVMYPRPDDLSLHVNYHHNPYLPKISLQEAELCRLLTPGKYAHDWEGRPDDANADAQILPYAIIERCLQGWEQRPQISPQMRADLGLDIAYGGDDNCAAAFHVGPILNGLKVWRGTRNFNETARIATDFFDEQCQETGVQGDYIYYDAANPMEGAFEATDCQYPTEGVGFGWSPTGPDMYWEQGITNKDYFSKRNIQMATGLRQRAIRTGLYLDGQSDIDPWTCLFINPAIGNTERLMGMLTQPVRRRNPTNDKWELWKHGAQKDLPSPDEFDAMCLTYSQDSYFGLQADL